MKESILPLNCVTNPEDTLGQSYRVVLLACDVLKSAPEKILATICGYEE